MYRHTSTSGASCVRRWAGSPAGSPSRAARQASPETAGRRYSAGGRPAAHPQQPGADRCAALDLERGHDRVAIQPQHVDPLNGLGGHPVELLRQLLTAAGHIPSRCPFHTRLWSFLATWTSKPISARSLTGRYWISAWPLTAASGFLAARGLVILRHRHPAVGRPRHDSGLVADPRQPAQRPRHRVGLHLVQRRTTASPSAAFPLAGEPRNGPCQRLGLSRSWKTVSSPRISSTGTPKLGAHRADDPDANPVGENPGAPDRRPIEERLTGDLQ